MNKKEIEVGDYIRTKGDGLIRKVKGIEQYKYTFDTYYICEKTNTHYMEEDIKKYSKNIIDLIEEGDFVNGERIDYIVESSIKVDGVMGKYLFYNTETPMQEYYPYIFREHEIKTILTHEQYEENCFRVEE